jgi:D-xylose transport system permease protein
VGQSDPLPASGGRQSTEEVEPAIDQLDAGAAPEASAFVPPEVVANTMGEYLGAQLRRIRGGESGMLPVFVGLIVIVIVFQVMSPNGVFLTAGNIVNLFQQSAVFMVLSMAEIFVLLLGEIDLSLGYLLAVGGTIAVQLVQPATTDWPWWAAIAAALTICAFVGGVWGTLITRLRLPSFIVTLGGLLILNGVLLWILALGPFSGYPSLNGKSTNLRTIYNLMWGRLSPLAGWIVMAVAVALLSLNLWLRDNRRRRSGLVAPPQAVTYIKIVLLAAVGVAVVAICNVNRASIGTLRGVPWAIPVVLGVLTIWTVLLQRMRYGRYVYAIGGNAEAARRAGINVSKIRTLAFVLAGLTAGMAGLLYAAYLGGMSNNVNGGQLVLYAVAGAVIGGTSLFGGRGKIAHGVLGGLVIGAIYNGMGLLGLQVQWEFIVTGGVLILAVIVDALSRRGATSGSMTRV